MRGMPARKRERGISDVVAFVLTFSIIIFGVGLVSTGAFDSLVSFSDSQQIENSERGLEAAAASLDNINQNNDTYRQFDVGVAGGTLFYNTTEIEVTVENESGGTEYDETIPIDALEKRFEDDNVALTLEGGGVFRDPSASARYKPPIRCGSADGQRIGDDVAIISLLNMTTDDSIRKSDSFDNDVAISPTRILDRAPLGANSEVARLDATLVAQERKYVDISDDLDVTVDVSGTASPEQWSIYFDNAGWSDDPNDQFSCEAETALVRITTVEISRTETDST